jgi:small nuclear ribonucleoprotein D2
MYVLNDKAKAEMTPQELDTLEKEEFTRGPFSILSTALSNHSPILVSLRNGHKLLGTVKAFDRHCNLIMTEVTEIWTERGRRGRGAKKARAANKERFISKLFVRGDSVILVVAGRKK